MATLPTLFGEGKLASSDDIYLQFANASNGQVISETFSDTPANFGTMQTLSWTSEHSISATHDDSFSLGIRIMSGSTVLAAADSAGAYVNIGTVSGTLDKVVGPTAFAYLNTTATKNQWDAGKIDLKQTYTAAMAVDAAAIRVDQIQFTGTHTLALNLTHTFSAAGDAVVLTWGDTGATSYTLTRDGVTVYTGANKTFSESPARGQYTYQVSDGTLTSSDAVDFRVYSEVVKADVPLSYWRMNVASGTTVSDEMAAVAGVLKNGSTGNQVRVAQAGPVKEDGSGSVYFENTSATAPFAHADFGDNYDLSTAGSYTIEGWFLLPGGTGVNQYGWGPSADWNPLLSKGEGEWQTRRGGSSDPNNTIVFTGWGNDQRLAASPDPTDGNWHYLVCVYNHDIASKTVYYDGKTLGEITQAATTSPNGADTLKMAWIIDFDRASKVLMAEWAVYNKALSAARVKAHYASRLVATLALPPATPTGLIAAVYNDVRIDLSWNSAATATSYTLEHSVDNATWTAITGITTTSYSHTGRTADTNYYYRVSAVNSGGSSAPSASISTKTKPTPAIVRYAPDTLITQTNLTGALSTIQDDPDSPDANWMTGSDNVVLTLAFPTPTAELSKGAGRQEFKLRVRQT